MSWSSLLRNDKYDWALVVAFTVLGYSTEKVRQASALDAALYRSRQVEPFHQFLQKEDLYLYAFPFKKKNSIPSWSVVPIALLVPIGVFAALHSWARLDRRTVAKLVLGLFASCSFTLALTNCIKLAVGRPRPNFVARCWQTTSLAAVSSLPEHGGIPGFPQCTNPSASEVREGLKSFPSGHVSLTAAGLFFLCAFLLRATRPNGRDSTSAFIRLVLALVPALMTLIVAITRMRDYWHHPTDCLAGALIGGLTAHMARDPVGVQCAALDALAPQCLSRVLPLPPARLFDDTLRGTQEAPDSAYLTAASDDQMV
jgi:membrane-associated phospholipid phosphatase